MSSSPFASFDLATLVFRVGDGTPTIDETGNVSVSSQELTVKAYLVPANQRNAIQSVPGEFANLQAMEGRYVEPFRRPPELLPGMKADAIIGGQTGIFELGLSPASGIPAMVANALGDPISGTFRVTSNRGNFA